MMLSEEEAKKKHCHRHKPVSMSEGPLQTDCCIGSACMAWRWEPEEDFDERYSQWDDRFTVAVPEGTTYEPEPQQKGYCGLAGPSS